MLPRLDLRPLLQALLNVAIFPISSANAFHFRTQPFWQNLFLNLQFCNEHLYKPVYIGFYQASAISKDATFKLKNFFSTFSNFSKCTIVWLEVAGHSQLKWPSSKEEGCTKAGFETKMKPSWFLVTWYFKMKLPTILISCYSQMKLPSILVAWYSHNYPSDCFIFDSVLTWYESYLQWCEWGSVANVDN